MNRLKIVIPLLVVAAILTSCSGISIPFTISTPTQTIELPNTVGLYFEKAVDIPPDAQRSGVTFDSITLHYSIRRKDSFLAQVKIYASTEQTADNKKAQGDETLIDATLALNQTQLDGSCSSANILTALQNKQAKFVIGAENLSPNPTGSVLIDITVEITGSFSLFGN